MPYRLRFESLDNPLEEKDFDSPAEAIDYARWWFLDGYANNTIDDAGRQRAQEYVERLLADLRAGREFHCGMFHERISFVPHPSTAGKNI